MRMTFLTTVALGAFLAFAPPALADDTTPPSDPPAVELYSPADAQAVLDARIIALKTVIGLSADQEKLWAPVETAIRQIAVSSAARRAERAGATEPASFVDVLERTADAEATRAAELKTVAAALKPLVASLTPEQQRRIPAFLGLREANNGMPQPTAELWLFEEEQ
ncbi:Spy/CpxP family protein refolding chaperone [Mesorhizobium sp. BR1-1-16]|uniref:Spy/CpxP family protein refolding chaperone n=1 Tax=Mesorhizobium sp. BR1-1-16 TaxID=2876653 RepID=UPI001CCDC8E2|nr:Spy/CpxP family protein refolding chaperone [Mesorhizobium sp. BR1-1-16]MBZ9939219.1 Spy/CpxP family protein refolding chaperone [Mesorhizobium sp. BR1-1-16]